MLEDESCPPITLHTLQPKQTANKLSGGAIKHQHLLPLWFRLTSPPTQQTYTGAGEREREREVT